MCKQGWMKGDKGGCYEMDPGMGENCTYPMHGCEICRQHKVFQNNHEFEEQVCLQCQPMFLKGDMYMGEEFGMRTNSHCNSHEINHCFTQEMKDQGM